MTILYTITYQRVRGGDLIEETRHGVPARLASTMKTMLGARFLSCVREIAEAPRQRRGRFKKSRTRTSEPTQQTTQQPKRPATTLAGMISEEAEKYVE